MSWIRRLAEFGHTTRAGMLRCLRTGAALLGVALSAFGASAEDVVSEGTWFTDTCEACGDGIGGWNLYWHGPHDCNSSCRCNGGRQTCPGAERPRFFGSVEFLPLLRDQMSSSVYQARAVEVVNGTTTTYKRSAVLTEDDFANEFDPGMRITLGLYLGDLWRLEGSYVGNYSWSDTAEAHWVNDGSGNLLSPFSGFGDVFRRPGLATLSSADYLPVSGQDFNETARISYTSSMMMSEINLRRRLENIATSRVAAESSVLIGFRQMKVSETFSYFTSSSVPVVNTQNSVNVQTDNDLYGPQIGGMAQFLVSSRSWVDFEAKGAMLFGRADNVFSAQIPVSAGPPSGPFADSQDITAFLGDLSLQYNFQVTRSITFKAGYNAFFLSGVALASKNFDSSVDQLLNGPGSLDHSGRIVYHGPSMGVVWAR